MEGLTVCPNKGIVLEIKRFDFATNAQAYCTRTATMEHEPFRPFAPLYTVPEEAEEPEEQEQAESAAPGWPVTDHGEGQHSISDAARTGAKAAQDPDIGPARPVLVSGGRAAPGAGSPAASLLATPWPAGRLAGGFLELRAGSRLGRRSTSALCTIQDGVLSFRSDPRTGEDARLLATMKVKDIVVTVYRNAPRQFVISSCIDPALHERTLFRRTRIHCMASSQEARNKWLAVLHRTGVHLHGEMEDCSIRRVRQGVPQAL